MSPEGCNPVHFLDRVMDRMEAPERRDGMKRTVCDVDAQIGQHDDLQHLEPCCLSADGQWQARWYQQRHRTDRRRQQHPAAVVDEGAIEGGVDQIVDEALAEYLLLRTQGQNSLQRNEDQSENQQRFDSKIVHQPTPKCQSIN